MTDTDDHSEQLRAKFFGNVSAKPASVAKDRNDVVVDPEIEQRFAERLLEPSERKWRERQQRREKSDRRQEGQDRWGKR